jgi:hypothetical protein
VSSGDGIELGDAHKLPEYGGDGGMVGRALSELAAASDAQRHCWQIPPQPCPNRTDDSIAPCPVDSGAVLPIDLRNSSNHLLTSQFLLT